MTKLSLCALIGAALSSSNLAAQDPILGSTAVTWEEIQARPAGASGMSKPVLRSATATLDELEIHITAVPPGRATHPPHTHPDEEVIVIREGTLDAFQDGRTRRIGPGSVVFQAANQPHNLTNVGDTTAVYHVIKWNSPGMLEARRAAAPEEVLGAERRWAEALTKADLKALHEIYADDLLYVHSGGNAETKREFLERVERGGLRYRKLELVDPKVRVYGDAAVVNGAFEVNVDVDGSPVTTRVVYIHVYARQDGRWRMVAHQTTRAPGR